MRLGDLDALKKRFEELHLHPDLIELIDNAPTVETYTIEDIQVVREDALILGAKLAQRPEGEWIAHEDMDEWYECNKCHCGNTYFDKLPNFCPNCGADMRKGGAE